MKHLKEKTALYCPPEVVVMALDAEGILCASQHESYSVYDGNQDFGWED
jgi:hypothetical protein